MSWFTRLFRSPAPKPPVTESPIDFKTVLYGNPNRFDSQRRAYHAVSTVRGPVTKNGLLNNFPRPLSSSAPQSPPASRNTDDGVDLVTPLLIYGAMGGFDHSEPSSPPSSVDTGSSYDSGSSGGDSGSPSSSSSGGDW